MATEFQTLGEIVIEGRPDFADHDFGKTYAKTFPEYVYSSNHQGYLVHKVHHVTLHWWRGSMDQMIRLRHPQMIAETVCGMSKFIQTGGRIRASFCAVPKPDAVLCKNMSRRRQYVPRKDPTSKERARLAKVKLGCIAITK